MDRPSLSVIIPVFNEVRTISSVIEIVRTWGKANEIIVVCDGSTDKTPEAVKRFVPVVTIISYTKNHGKGYALYRGIQKSTGEIVMFLDGDIVGLTHEDLDRMVEPILHNKADMVLGLLRFASLGSFEPFNTITGERVVFRKDIEPISRGWKHIGYGVEVMMNEAYKKKRVVQVTMPYVFILSKLEKQALPDAMVSYVKEGVDMLTQIAKDQTELMKPHARKIIRSVITYLQQAIT